MIIHPDKMVKNFIELLERSVEHLPEEDRDKAKDKILRSFAGVMFYAPFNGAEQENT